MENILRSPEFVQFLLRAKRATYAAGAAPGASSRPASSDLQYQEESFLYIDTYLGSRDFLGEEAVWHQNTPIWGMNYHGLMLVDEIPAGFGEILHAALSDIPADAPYRGPAELRMGRFRYLCAWQGSIERFSGSERIEQDGRAIYELAFHGGQINS